MATLADLRTQSELGDVAFLASEDVIYFSQHKKASPGEPQSAITALIQGIWDKYPDKARGLLRNRIYSTQVPTEMCFGMVKVAAKRLSIISSLDLQAKLFSQQNYRHVEICFMNDSI